VSASLLRDRSSAALARLPRCWRAAEVSALRAIR